MVFWALKGPYPKWHLDQFSHFSAAQVCDQQTDRPHYNSNTRPHYNIHLNVITLPCEILSIF